MIHLHRRVRTKRGLTAIKATTIVLLLSTSYFAFGHLSLSSAQSNAHYNQYSDRALSLLNTVNRVNYSFLQSLAGGSNSVSDYYRVIQEQFIPYNIRQVLLDIGWDNYSIGSIQQQQWVSNWLSACDELGIQNLLYVGQLTANGIGSTWIQSLIANDPSTQTFYSNGRPAPYISIDNPDVENAIEKDLILIFQFYGPHQSLVGLSTGSPFNDPYYSGNLSMPVMGYSNNSIQLFANSPYFASDVNQSGFHPDGTLDAIWSSIKNVSNPISFSSGNWVSASPYQLAGNSTFGTRLAMRFYIPREEQSIQLLWYGYEVGSPGPLEARIYADKKGTVDSRTQLSFANQSASAVSKNTGWQNSIQFAGNFSQGYYWVVFRAYSNSSASYYNIYKGNQPQSTDLAAFSFTLTSSWLNFGSSILWIKDSNGLDLTIYPYRVAVPASASQSFEANQTVAFNAVFLYVLSQNYNDANTSIIVLDKTANQIVATAPISQRMIHGLLGWVPFMLNREVTLVPNHQYVLQLNVTRTNNQWIGTFASISADPVEAGFQNQSRFWLFRLADLQLGPLHFDYNQISSTSSDSIRLGHSFALRFSPSSNETFETAGLLMKTTIPNKSNYTNGNLTVSLWSDNRTSATPQYPIIQSITVNSSRVPQNGWLTVTGFDAQLDGGANYWIVASTSSNTTFTLAELSNPYSALVKVSNDNESTWHYPTGIPYEVGYRIILSQESFENSVFNIPKVVLSTNTQFAQPISVSENTQLIGLFLGPLGRTSKLQLNDSLLVSIHPDNGSQSPSSAVLGSGLINGDNLTSTTLEYAQFTSVVNLSPGKLYWIVLQPLGGTYFVQSAQYVTNSSVTSNRLSAILSTSAGNSWNTVNNETLSLSYALISPTSPFPTYNTTQVFETFGSYHDFTTQSGELKGWNAYIQSTELNAMSTIANQFSHSTGADWHFYVSVEPNIEQVLMLQNVNLLPLNNTISDCPSLLQYFLKQIPVNNAQFYYIPDLALIERCSSVNFGSFAQILNYMKYSNQTFNSGSGIEIRSVEPNATNASAAASLSYSATGNMGGPLLLWLSNSSPGTQNISLQINGSIFGISQNWQVLDLSNLQTYSGNSNNITVQLSILPYSWKPLYIVSNQGELLSLYSNLNLAEQFTYPNQSLYRLSGVVNQSALVVISLQNHIQNVGLDDHINLTRVTTAQSLINVREGWYYDDQSGSLLVKFISTGNDSLRVLGATTPIIQKSELSIEPVLLSLLILAVADVGVFVFIRYRNTGRKKI